jgi:hypothetical protein
MNSGKVGRSGASSRPYRGLYAPVAMQAEEVLRTLSQRRRLIRRRVLVDLDHPPSRSCLRRLSRPLVADE